MRADFDVLIRFKSSPFDRLPADKRFPRASEMMQHETVMLEPSPGMGTCDCRTRLIELKTAG